MWYNPIMSWLLRSSLHFLVSNNLMLMTYTGRKSGKSYTTPMNYLIIDGDLYTISSRERVWWRNLRGSAQVMLRLKGNDIPARAEVFEDESQVTNSLAYYFEIAPQFARYLGVSIHPQAGLDPENLARLARERVVVRSVLK